jgi:hypothetical protein
MVSVWVRKARVQSAVRLSRRGNRSTKVRVDRGLTPARSRCVFRGLSLVGPPALAVLLVFHDLTVRSLWSDEGVTFTTVTQHGAAAFHLHGDGGNMVAFYGLLHVLVGWFGDSTLMLRLPSALAVVVTVCLVQQLVERLLDRLVALLAALFVTVCLPFIYWGQMARGYALAICFLTAATLAFVMALRSERPGFWIAFVLLSVVSIYTILLSALYVLFLIASAILLPREAVPLRRIAAASAGIVTLCVPLMIVAADAGDYPIRWIEPIAASKNAYIWHFLTGTEVVTVSPSGSSGAVMLATLVVWAAAFFLLATDILRRGRSWSAWGLGVLVFTFVGPVAGMYALSVLVHPVFQDRYVLTAVVPGSVLVAYVVSRVRPLWFMTTLAVLFLGVRAVQLSPSYGVPVENWQAAANYVLESAGPGDCIAFFQNVGYAPFDFYVSHDHFSEPSALPRLVLPATTWASHTLVENPPSLGTSALHQVRAHCPVVWLVTTHVDPPVVPGSPPWAYQVHMEYGALLKGLDQSYSVTSDRVFVGVEVRRYVPARPTAN